MVSRFRHRDHDNNTESERRIIFNETKMTDYRYSSLLSLTILLSTLVVAASFVPNAKTFVGRSQSSHLHLFNKMFEESGPLGKGITVGKVQVALVSTDRSLFKLLERKARAPGNSSAQLAKLANEVCLTLLRKSDDWTGACSDSKWFSEKDSGKAEGQYNTWTNKEAAKFEKEYIPDSDSGKLKGGSTIAVISLVIEIQGDETNFVGAGFSIAKTKDVLSSIASDCLVDGGQCVNAVEVFWTPGEPNEVLSSRDVVLDFPEIIDL